MVELSQEHRDRIKSAAGVAAFHALLGYAFLTGLGFEVGTTVSEQLKLFDVREEPPPPPAEPPPPVTVKKPTPKKATPNPEGAASPKSLKNTPTPVVAPPPEVRLPVPTPIIAAPVPGLSNQPAAGASDVPGPGTGAGGIGSGLGSGAYGTGTGGGGGGGGLRARWISGEITDRDYPASAVRTLTNGTVYIRFTVAPTGRVSDCTVTRSSGHRDLDSTTCRLILRRFRYRPARDASGRPVPEVVRGHHEWEIERRVSGPPIELDEYEDEPQDD